MKDTDTDTRHIDIVDQVLKNMGENKKLLLDRADEMQNGIKAMDNAMGIIIQAEKDRILEEIKIQEKRCFQLGTLAYSPESPGLTDLEAEEFEELRAENKKLWDSYRRWSKKR